MKKENDISQMLDLSTHPYSYDPYGAYTQSLNIAYGNDLFTAAALGSASVDDFRGDCGVHEPL
jgi:hypothetical protein